jgi:hypothetical protein
MYNFVSIIKNENCGRQWKMGVKFKKRKSKKAEMLKVSKY